MRWANLTPFICFRASHIAPTVSAVSMSTVKSQWNTSCFAAMLRLLMLMFIFVDIVAVISSRMPCRSMPSMLITAEKRFAIPPQLVATSLDPYALFSLIATGQSILCTTTFSSSSTNPNTSSPGIGEQQDSNR